LAKTEMTLIMPKFKFETDFVLNEVLQKMGVRKAFTSSAQLGGISDAGIAVDEVRQKCFIEVNEQGSEAAAVTSIGVRLTSARPGRPVVMTVDRPFLFAIVDRADDNILFMGRVMNLQK
ncbi:MAG: serpin family protein, partial [Bacteroidetes bacterium]|nr:serpin family protein [Candidatus Cryptobacteroides merdavium]